MKKTEDNLVNVKDARDRFDVIEGSLMSVKSGTVSAYDDALRALNGTMDQSARSVVAADLRELQKTMVKDLNATYDDQFIFGGTSTKGLPFEFDEENNILKYRGLDVNDPDNFAQLKQLSENDPMHVDLGFGLAVGDDRIVEGSSAYDISTPGIKYIGFGTNTNGVSECSVTLIGQLADELEKEPLDQGKLKQVTDQLEVNKNKILTSITMLGSNSHFLEATQNRLEANEVTLNNKIDNTEFVDLPSAISDFSYAQFAYNASLKIGTSILTPSFIDFMK